MNLAVDARLMAGHPRGMGQFARALVAGFPSDQIMALLPAGHEAYDWPAKSCGWGFFPWWEQFVLPNLAREVRASHLLCPSNTGPILPIRGIKTIAVIHDLIYLEPFSRLRYSPSPYQNFGRLYRRAVAPRLIAHADHIITVSHFTKSQLEQNFDVSQERMTVIPNSLSEDWFVATPLEDCERQRYLFTVAGEAPSKNVGRLLEGFAAFRNSTREKDLILKIAGISPSYHPVFRAKAEALGISNAVDFLGRCDLPTLRNLYQMCWGFIFASLYEGFGIPLLEAMASGAPAACSNTTSLPEVASDSAILFDPREKDAIGQAIKLLCEDRQERIARAAKGLAAARQYNQHEVGARIRQFWQEQGA